MPSRWDNVGLLWEDIEYQRKLGGNRTYVMQPIPESSWKPPREYPDLSSAKVLAVDIETYDPNLVKQGAGWAYGEGYIAGVSVACDGYRAYFPMRHTVQAELNLDPDHTMEWLKWLLALPMPKVGANLLYDYGWLRSQGVVMQGELRDVQIAQGLIDESSSVNLQYLGQRYLGLGKASSELYEWCSLSYGGVVNGKQRSNIYRAPVTMVGVYAESDAYLPLEIDKLQQELLSNDNLTALYKMENALIPLLYEMRAQGVRVDLEAAERMNNSLSAELEVLYSQLVNETKYAVSSIWKIAPLVDYFKEQGLKMNYTPTGKESFDASWLKNQDHPTAKLILDIRQKQKLRDTFIRGYLLGCNKDGRIHCNFHNTKNEESGTISGRFSSSAPNLQNIPKRSELGKAMRKLFIPEQGGRWRRYDQSQVEYRMLAHHAVGMGSDEIRSLYNKDPKIDFHKATGELIFKLTNIQLDRETTKTINFGLTYGMGNKALFQQLHAYNHSLTESQCKQFLKAYQLGVPFSQTTLAYFADQAQRLGFVKTHLGRTTHFNLYEPLGGRESIALPLEQAIEKYGYTLQRSRTHKALNAVLQGGAADLMKMGMLRAYQDGIFKKVGIPHLTVHDELDFSDMGASEKDWKELQHILENAMPCYVPFVCEPEIGINWGETKEVTNG